MISRILYRMVWLGLLVLILISIFSAFATSVTVPVSRVGDMTYPITANDLKPPECAGLDLTNVVVGSNGGPDNDLILGSANADTLAGGEGDDCIVGGGDNDTLMGENGNDVLVGGSGDDTLNGGADSNDVCYGGDGTDSFDASCETQTQ
jgi:Ca2+-binding RTX toxin-like protein